MNTSSFKLSDHLKFAMFNASKTEKISVIATIKSKPVTGGDRVSVTDKKEELSKIMEQLAPIFEKKQIKFFVLPILSIVTFWANKDDINDLSKEENLEHFTIDGKVEMI